MAVVQAIFLTLIAITSFGAMYLVVVNTKRKQ